MSPRLPIIDECIWRNSVRPVRFVLLPHLTPRFDPFIVFATRVCGDDSAPVGHSLLHTHLALASYCAPINAKDCTCHLSRCPRHAPAAIHINVSSPKLLKLQLNRTVPMILPTKYRICVVIECLPRGIYACNGLTWPSSCHIHVHRIVLGWADKRILRVLESALGRVRPQEPAKRPHGAQECDGTHHGTFCTNDISMISGG